MIAGKFKYKINNKSFKLLNGFDNSFSIRKDDISIFYFYISDVRLRFINELKKLTEKQKSFSVKMGNLKANFEFISAEWDEIEGIIELKLKCL